MTVTEQASKEDQTESRENERERIYIFLWTKYNV